MSHLIAEIPKNLPKNYPKLDSGENPIFTK
jgi:hypothetical protein